MSQDDRLGSAEAQSDPVAVSAARLRGAEGRRNVAEAKLVVTERELEKTKQTDDQAVVAEAKVAVAEAKVVIAEAKSGVADAELGVAKANLRVTEAELEKAKQSGNHVAVAEANAAVAKQEAAVAKQEAAVAEAKAAVAEVKWASARPNEKDVAKAGLDRAIHGLKLAQDAYERALHTGVLPGSGGAPATHSGAEAGWKLVEKIAEDQNRMKTSLHMATETLRCLRKSLTPSEALSDKYSEFQLLLDRMKLKIRNVSEEQLGTAGQPSDQWPHFSFAWSAHLHSVEESTDMTTLREGIESLPDPDSASCGRASKHKDPLESQCYEPVQAYVSSAFPDLDVKIVSEGESLPHKLLFSEDAFTSRREKPEDVHGQDVIHITNIQGRADIAAFEKGGEGRSYVKFAIEMKSPNRAKNAEREAITQLLGLNIANPYNSPPVVLSNAVMTHRVFYVERLADFPFFGIVQANVTSLRCALWLVRDLITRKACTAHFGRGPSPTSSQE